jgi:transposase
MATLPIPIQSKPVAMPGDDSLRLDQEQCRAPIVPQSRKPDPQDTVSPTQTQPTPTARTLQDQFTVVLANAQHIKNVPGRKTDQKDAEWIAQLLQHGLLRPSYVPCEIIRDLRDLTRMRATLSQEASRISSRVHKVLEDANVKLASVATNTLGKSGRAMLGEIIAGQNDPEYFASLALGHLRAKAPQLRLALEGKIRPHHRFLLRRLLAQLRFVEHEIVLLDERLEDIGRERPELSQAVARWDTIPGIERVALATTCKRASATTKISVEITSIA